jgi:hypothetical protein
MSKSKLSSSLRSHQQERLLVKASALRQGSGSASRHTSAYVSIRQHTSAYVSIRQHTSAYVSIRQHTSTYVRQGSGSASRHQQPALRQVYDEQEQGMSSEQRKSKALSGCRRMQADDCCNSCNSTESMQADAGGCRPLLRCSELMDAGGSRRKQAEL